MCGHSPVQKNGNHEVITDFVVILVLRHLKMFWIRRRHEWTETQISSIELWIHLSYSFLEVVLGILGHQNVALCGPLKQEILKIIIKEQPAVLSRLVRRDVTRLYIFFFWTRGMYHLSLKKKKSSSFLLYIRTTVLPQFWNKKKKETTDDVRENSFWSKVRRQGYDQQGHVNNTFTTHQTSVSI